MQRVTGDTGEDTFVAAEPTILARVPVLRYAEPPDASGVYAFLGGATIPRLLRRHNPLRRIPHVIVQRIARFAHAPANYRAHWSGIGDPERLAVEVDVTDSYDDDFTLCLPPIGSGVIYVEVRLNCAWLGTCLIIHGLGQPFEFELGGSHGGDIVRLVVEDAEVQGLVIPSLGVNSWSWCNDPVTFGVLVDMVRGCVTLRLNGLDGPCVRFPGVEWRSGVQVLVEEWPSPAVIDRDLPRVAVSCATPPPPPSLLVAAEEPMTVEEHLATGSLESLE